MPNHLFEVIFTSVGLFMAPLMLVAAMAGALTLADRLFQASRQPHRPRGGPRSL